MIFKSGDIIKHKSSTDERIRFIIYSEAYEYRVVSLNENLNRIFTLNQTYIENSYYLFIDIFREEP